MRASARSIESVAAFHQAYLELGGTPRKKSVGKDRLLAGVPIGRKLNRMSKAQRKKTTAAMDAGMSRIPTGFCGTNRRTLVPSASQSNRHGMGGQASKAADMLNLNRSYGATNDLQLRVGPGSSSFLLWGSGRDFVKVADRQFTVVLRGAGCMKRVPPEEAVTLRM